MRLSMWQASCCAILLMAVDSLRAQTKVPHYAGNSPREFVEEFYKWYVPFAVSNNTTVGWNNTLKAIHPEISPLLAKLLDEDSSAQAKCKDLVGLDFDPFLYTQEPAAHYKVGKITQTGGHFRAGIYRVESGHQSEKPEVIAEFMHQGGDWLFVNFHYSDGGNLLTVLKSRPPCLTPKVSDKS